MKPISLQCFPILSFSLSLSLLDLNLPISIDGLSMSETTEPPSLKQITDRLCCLIPKTKVKLTCGLHEGILLDGGGDRVPLIIDLLNASGNFTYHQV